jgi:mRNA-degrading endonuclease RelE of RelBE toxin-antitoxin system
MDISYTKIALKALQGYDRPTRNRIRERIATGPAKTPPVGDIKPLVGENGVFRLRVGKYRIKFEYFMKTITKDDGSTEQERALHIIDIDSRGDIYK